MARFRKFLIAVGVILVLGVIAVLSAFYNFPLDSVGTMVKNRIESYGPLRVHYQNAQPGLPFRVHISGIDAAMIAPGAQFGLLQNGKLRYDVNPVQIAFGKVAGNFVLRAFGGRATGFASSGWDENSNVSIDVKQIDMPDFSMSAPDGSAGLRGRVTGSLQATGSGGVFPTSGKGLIKVGPGRIEGLKIPNLPIAELDFDMVTIEFTMDSNAIRVEKMEIKSKMGDILLTGRVADYTNPQLGLTGTVAIGQTRTHLTITGPIHQPRVNVTGMSLNQG